MSAEVGRLRELLIDREREVESLHEECNHLVARNEALHDALSDLLAEIENEPERWALDPHCGDCTQGQTPVHLEKICAFHRAKNLLHKEPRDAA